MTSSGVSAGVSAKGLLQVSQHFDKVMSAHAAIDGADYACGVAACSNCCCQRFHFLVFDGLAVWLVRPTAN